MLGEKAVDYFALGLKPLSYALSFKLRLGADGAIEEVSIHRTKLSVIRMTYEEADAQKDTPALAPLFAIAEKNLIRREISCRPVLLGNTGSGAPCDRAAWALFLRCTLRSGLRCTDR